MNDLQRRVAALETRRAGASALEPTLAHWRLWNAGQGENVPPWAIEQLEQRRVKAHAGVLNVLRDFDDIIHHDHHLRSASNATEKRL